MALISTVLSAVAVAALFLNQAGLALLEPKSRWWLVARRKTLSVAAQVRPITGHDISTKTFNVSKSGAFFTLNGVGSAVDEIRVGGRCSVRLALDQLHSIQCSAEVVRKADPTEKYPGGFAVRFLDLSNKDQNLLSQMCQH